MFLSRVVYQAVLRRIEPARLVARQVVILHCFAERQACRHRYLQSNLVAGIPVAGIPVAGIPVAGTPVAGIPVAGEFHIAAAGVPKRGAPDLHSIHFCCICCRRAVSPSTTSGSL